MIRVFSIDITSTERYDKLSRDYLQAIVSKKSKKADRLQRVIEGRMAKTINAKVVSGKYGQTDVADYILRPDSPILSKFKQDVSEKDPDLAVEFKALSSEYKGTKIGQITLTTDKSYFTAGNASSISGVELVQQLSKTKKTGYLLDIDPEFTNQKTGAPKNRDIKSVTNIVFNKYFRRDPRLKALLYAKASTMLLNNLYSFTIDGKKIQGTRLVGLKIPIEDFNSTNFKVKIVDKALVLSINDTFQRKLFELLNKTYLEELKNNIAPRQEIVKIGKQSVKVWVTSPIEGTQAFGTYVTNSIKVFPSDTITVKAALAETKKESGKKQQFLSNIQWTMLTQKRLGESMKRIGEPEPPNIKERSGRFRHSVEVMANYRKNIISYTYNPLYRGLEHYGYHPELQVERAIKEVAQQLYNRHFIITRAGSLA